MATHGQKNLRQYYLDTLVITHNGFNFKADNTAQGFMHRTHDFMEQVIGMDMEALSVLGATLSDDAKARAISIKTTGKTFWLDENGVPVEVTLVDLKIMLTKAMAETQAIYEKAEQGLLQ